MKLTIYAWDDLTREQQRSFINYVNNKRKIGRRPDRHGNQVRLLMTFEEVRDVWLASGQILNRGTRSGQYCLSRVGDTGDYLPGRVFTQLTTQNSREGKVGRPCKNKGRVSPTLGMKMPTKVCAHCAKPYPNSAARHHVDAKCVKMQA